MKGLRFLSLAVVAVLCVGFVSCSNVNSGYGGDTGGTIGLVDTVADAVDLGLPSGILWASWNIGATSPEGYGGYYAWGETEEKDGYYWNYYKWCRGDRDTMNKYCTDSDCGTVDNKIVLEPDDDVAHKKWGNGWRMPTEEELEELTNNCTWEWITYNEVNGYKVTGKRLSNGNRNSIFLPAAGYRSCTSLDYAGCCGNYWSSTLNSNGFCNDEAYELNFGSGSHFVCGDYRYAGRSVRAVKDK